MSDFTKIFVIFALVILIFTACGTNSSSTGDDSNKIGAVTDELKTSLPFSVREPVEFQAEMVVTADGQERKTFIARNGLKRRLDFNFGQKNQVTEIETDKIYLIFPDRKIFAESTAGENFSSADEWSAFLTTEWLSEKFSAQFEKIESIENITRFRVRLEDSSASEMIVSVDETLGLAVKQEFFSVEGDRKTLTFIWELQNIKLQTDENLFIVPNGFKKVSLSELRKEISKNE